MATCVDCDPFVRRDGFDEALVCRGGLSGITGL